MKTALIIAGSVVATFVVTAAIKKLAPTVAQHIT
jgi:hypothetical protein